MDNYWIFNFFSINFQINIQLLQICSILIMKLNNHV